MKSIFVSKLEIFKLAVNDFKSKYAGSALASPETYLQGGKRVTQDKDNLYE